MRKPKVQGVDMSRPEATPESGGHAEGPLPDLAELCRIHEIGLDLIGRSHDLDELLDRVLEEYEARLQKLPADALDARTGAPRPETARQLRGLVMFATQAAALKEKAVLAGEMRRRAAMLEESNARLSEALDDTRRSHARLDGVLAALSSGVMLFDAEGGCLNANAAARAIATPADDAALAKLIAHDVPRNGEAEIDLPTAATGLRTLLVARRAMPGDPGTEVVLVTDVTQRNRAVDERVRLEKLAEVLKTLSVLSHKINNPLTALLGRAQILQAHKTVDPTVAKAAAVIAESSMRIADLIRELSQVVKEGRQDAVDDLLTMGGTSPAEDRR
jgi:PAS domain-containing protein